MQFSGSGLVPGGAKKKWLKDVVEFLEGKKKVKPSQIIKSIGKVFKIAGSIASHSAKFKQQSDTLNNYGDKLDKIGSTTAQVGSGTMTFGYGYNKKSYEIMEGGRKKRTPIKNAVRGFINFVNGKTKVKPSGLIKFGSVITGVIGAGALALGQPEIGAPLLAGSAALGKQSKALQQEGKGRLLEGHDSITSHGGALFPIMKAKSKCVSNLRKQTIPGTKNIFTGKPKKRYTKANAKAHCKEAVSNITKYVENYDPQRQIKYTIQPTGAGLKPGGAGGLYFGSGKPKTRGTKEQVWNGMAMKTSSGLTKNDLMKNSKGKVVSKKMHARGKQLSSQHGFKKK